MEKIYMQQNIGEWMGLCTSTNLYPNLSITAHMFVQIKNHKGVKESKCLQRKANTFIKRTIGKTTNKKTAHLKNWRTFINKQHTNKQNPHQLSPQEATLLSSSDTAMLVNSSLWSLVWYNSCDNKKRKHKLYLPLRWQTWFSSFANKYCRSHRMAH